MANEQGLKLINAAAEGDVTLCEEILSGAVLAEGDTALYVALHEAARHGNQEVISSLLWYASNAEEKNKMLFAAQRNNGGRALHVAADNGHVQVVRTPLSSASGMEERSRMLFAPDSYGYTALHRAAESGFEEVTSALLPRVVEERHKLLLAGNNRAHIALHLAAWEGHKGVVTLLLSRTGMAEKSLMLLAQDTDGYSALMCAAEPGHEEVVNLILACADGMKERGRMLFAQNYYGNTALLLAAMNGHEGVVRAILSSANDNDGDAALHYAAGHGHAEVASARVPRGMEERRKLLLAENIHGVIALHPAAWEGHAGVVTSLFSCAGAAEKSMMLLANGKHGESALMCAAHQGHEEVVNLLLACANGIKERGSILFAQDECGDTALLLAAMEGHDEVVSALLSGANDTEERGRMLFAQNYDGDTVLLLAAMNGHEGVVRATLSGANCPEEWIRMLHLHNGAGETAVDTALEEGFDEVAELLKKAEEVAEEEMKMQKSLTVQRAVNRWGVEIANVLSGTRTFFPASFIPRDGPEECLRRLRFKGHMKVWRATTEAMGAKSHDVRGDAMIIYAYTLESDLCTQVTTAMRIADDQSLGPWRQYIWHLDKALARCPIFAGTAYRGIKILVPGSVYKPGTTVTWQSFSSATRKVLCVLEFLQCQGSKLTGTIFVIKTKAARCVKHISAIPSEEEVVPGANTHLSVQNMVKDEAGKRALVPELEDYSLDAVKIFTLAEL